MSVPPAPGSTLIEGVEAVICDVDGVIHRGPEVMPGAVEVTDRLAADGVRVVYATNNASRPPESLRDRLQEDGLQVSMGQVVTSSMAGAEVLRARLSAGARVLAVGGEGVPRAVEAAGLTPVLPGEPGAVEAVLQGYGPDVRASDLAEAAYAIQAGALWVATNEDLTLPTERGLAPGNGSLVRALRGAAGADPLVAGKPHAPLYELASAVAGAPVGRCLAVGDRLDTDIAGAVTTGMASVLVLTGVSTVADAVLAEPSMRPTAVVHVLPDLLAPWGVSPRGEQLARSHERLARAWADLDAAAADASTERIASAAVADIEALLLGA